jgi:hypothetical protein
MAAWDWHGDRGSSFSDGSAIAAAAAEERHTRRMVTITSSILGRNSTALDRRVLHTHHALRPAMVRRSSFSLFCRRRRGCQKVCDTRSPHNPSRLTPTDAPVTESQFEYFCVFCVCYYSHCFVARTFIITMRFSRIALLQALAACHLLLNPSPVQAFSHLSRNNVRYAAHKQQEQRCPTFFGSATACQLSNAAQTEDCGCADVIFGGDPSDRAKGIDARQAIRNSNIYRVSGEPVLMDDLLGEPETSGVSIVVFMRSLG